MDKDTEEYIEAAGEQQDTEADTEAVLEHQDTEAGGKQENFPGGAGKENDPGGGDPKVVDRSGDRDMGEGDARRLVLSVDSAEKDALYAPG